MSNRSTQPIDVFIGKRLRRRRERLGWTQQQLGEKLGVKFQQVQKYEVGQNRIAASRLYEMARLLRVPLMYFFDGFEEPAAPPPDKPDNGLHDESALFAFDNAAAAKPAAVPEEWQTLADFYLSIGDGEVRRSLVSVARALAQMPAEPDSGSER